MIRPKFEETLEDMDLMCPYCNESIGDSWEYNFDDDSIEIECDCGKKFYGSVIETRSYKGRADCVLNGEKHDFKNLKGYNLKKCEICGDIK